MNRLLVSGLAMALALAGCTTTQQARLEPDVETVQPAGVPAYTATGSTATIVVPPPASAVMPPPGTIMPPSSTWTTASGTVVTTPSGTVVAAPGTVITGPGTVVTTPPPPGTGTVVAAPGTVVTAPSTGTVVTAPATAPIPQSILADEIKADRAHAHTVYANKIEAREVRGLVHQNRDFRVGKTSGDIRGSEVVASVIYADEIEANSVIAEHIYVRDLERR